METNEDLQSPKEWTRNARRISANWNSLVVCFLTGIKMETPGNFTWSETAGWVNAFSISRVSFEISAQNTCTFGFGVAFPKVRAPLLRGKNPQHFQGDGWLFPGIKTGCGREFSAVVCWPMGTAGWPLRAVLWNCRLRRRFQSLASRDGFCTFYRPLLSSWRYTCSLPLGRFLPRFTYSFYSF